MCLGFIHVWWPFQLDVLYKNRSPKESPKLNLLEGS